MRALDHSRCSVASYWPKVWSAVTNLGWEDCISSSSRLGLIAIKSLWQNRPCCRPSAEMTNKPLLYLGMQSSASFQGGILRHEMAASPATAYAVF